MTLNSNEQIGASITMESDRIAAEVMKSLYNARPELEIRYGEIGKEKCLNDTKYHLSYLSQAITLSHIELFRQYTAWAKVMLAGRNIPAEDLALALEFVQSAITVVMPASVSDVTRLYIMDAIGILPSIPKILPTYISPEQAHAEMAKKYLKFLLDGDRQSASQLILRSVENGMSIKNIYLDVFQQSQYEIGRLWQINEISVAQEHFCTAATQLIMSQLYPRIFSGERKGLTMVGACINGDLHELGIRIVSDFFEMEGWNTFYLGANMPDEGIIDTVKKRKADILALSVTFTPNVGKVKQLIKKIHASEIGRATKIIVGGYPFNTARDLWKEIDADGYASNAQEALVVTNVLLRAGVPG